MYNDTNRQDIIDFFMGLVASNPLLENAQNDIGIIALANTIGYKIDSAINQNTNKLVEFYNPTSETILLSRLMYEMGYIQFQKPLQISASLKSGSAVTLDKYHKFSSGVDVFMLDEEVSLESQATKIATLTMGTNRTISKTILGDENSLYFKVSLHTTYKKLYKVLAYRGEEEIIFSQQFVKPSSDMSMEIDMDGNLSLVFRLNNTYGLTLLAGDSISIMVFESYYTN